MGQSLGPEDPATLGPYRLTARLGAGGMGTVYLASGPAGDRVALKVIHRESAGDPAFRDRFRREVAAARRVRRFCTAPVLDASVDTEPFYVVTEYVAGPTLAEAVRDGGPLRGADLEGLAVGIATALGAIHDAGLVHRDLKPANVLLSAVGPRVIDFGIARALDARTGVTHTGQLIGTPAYMAPEQATGAAVTPATDVFAWAAVLAFAATARAPFEGRTIPEVLYRVAHEPPNLGGVDPALLPLLAAALDKDPERRPTVPALLSALTGGSSPSAAGTAPLPPPAAGPVQPPPPAAGWSPSTQPGVRPARGHWYAVAAALAAVAAVAALFVLRPDGPDRAAPNATSTPTATATGEAAADGPAAPSWTTAGASVPEAMIGTWTGVVDQTGAKANTYTVTVTLFHGGHSEVVGRTSYSLPCEGELVLEGVSGQSATFGETILSGGCSPASDLVLTLVGDGLRLTFADSGGNVGRALLER
ncbi:hypothetical protein GCM10022221_00970 [Actinocorallia aurea]